MPRSLPLALLSALALALTTFSPSSARPATPAALLGTNLIVNGDAEQGTGPEHETQLPAPSWTVVGGLAAMRYDQVFGHPHAGTPGPVQRGSNFFAGGATAVSSAHQEIDLSPLAEQIDRAALAYDLSGYLGGYMEEDDWTTLAVVFRDADGRTLASSSVGPVDALQRTYITMLLPRRIGGIVPIGTRSTRVQLQMTRGANDLNGDNDGYADNLSLVLSPVGQTRVYLPVVRR